MCQAHLAEAERLLVLRQPSDGRKTEGLVRILTGTNIVHYKSSKSMFYQQISEGKKNQTMKSNIMHNIGYFPVIISILYDTFIVLLENNESENGMSNAQISAFLN